MDGGNDEQVTHPRNQTKPGYLIVFKHPSHGSSWQALARVVVNQHFFSFLFILPPFHHPNQQPDKASAGQWVPHSLGAPQSWQQLVGSRAPQLISIFPHSYIHSLPISYQTKAGYLVVFEHPSHGSSWQALARAVVNQHFSSFSLQYPFRHRNQLIEKARVGHSLRAPQSWWLVGNIQLMQLL